MKGIKSIDANIFVVIDSFCLFQYAYFGAGSFYVDQVGLNSVL